MRTKVTDRNHTYLYRVRVTDRCLDCKHRHFGKCRDCECSAPNWKEAEVESFAGLDQVATKLHVKLDHVVYIGKEIVQ